MGRLSSDRGGGALRASRRRAVRLHRARTAHPVVRQPARTHLTGRRPAARCLRGRRCGARAPGRARAVDAARRDAALPAAAAPPQPAAAAAAAATQAAVAIAVASLTAGAAAEVTPARGRDGGVSRADRCRDRYRHRASARRVGFAPGIHGRCRPRARPTSCNRACNRAILSACRHSIWAGAAGAWGRRVRGDISRLPPKGVAQARGGRHGAPVRWDVQRRRQQRRRRRRGRRTTATEIPPMRMEHFEGCLNSGRFRIPGVPCVCLERVVVFLSRAYQYKN